MMCLKGQVPREEVGVSDRHFTVVPVTDLTGRLRAYAIIFKGDVLDATWPLGIDIDKLPIVGDILENMGPGKAMPGISVFDDDGKEIPVIFAASENASMTTSVLADIFRKMDLLGITQRGFNADGTPFGPAAIIDGHVSRMGEPFLVYISDDGTRWYVILGAPYGTALWQVHDDTRENGQFKMELASAKSALFQKKRVKGFDPNLVAEDIVIILQPAISKSFNIVKYAKKAISIRGWYPFNRAPLDLPEILSTAPEEVRKERVRILEARGVHSNVNAVVPPMEYNLLLSGSGALAGGAAVSDALAQTVTELNYTSATVSDVLALAQRTQAVNDGRNNNMAPNAARGNMMTSDQLRDTYRDVRRMTAGYCLWERQWRTRARGAG